MRDKMGVYYGPESVAAREAMRPAHEVARLMAENADYARRAQACPACVYTTRLEARATAAEARVKEVEDAANDAHHALMGEPDVPAAIEALDRVTKPGALRAALEVRATECEVCGGASHTGPCT